MGKKNMDKLLHSVIIGLGLYILMVMVLKQPKDVACDRSMLIAGLTLAYLVVFGYELPSSKINPNLKLSK